MVVSPLTGSEHVTLLRTIQANQLIRDWERSFQIDITDELDGYQEIYLYQCNQTKLKFFVPPDVTGSGQLYQQLQKFDWFYMADRWEHQMALQDLSDCNQILEIGCGFGSFVQAGIDAGLNIRGIELNEAAVRVAQEKSLPVKFLDLQVAANLYPQALDAVCSFQVLEHVPNPKLFIQRSLQMLKPRGKLIFCVPNSESFLKYQYNLLDMPPHHMLQWCEYSFRALEELFPVKLEKVMLEPLAAYHVPGYLTSWGNRYLPYLLGKLVFNRYTLPFYKAFLNLGLRKFLVGHSLYVQFRKV